MSYHYGVYEVQGRRHYMEDRHVEAGSLTGDPTKSFYGVFDGHGGSRAAEYVSSVKQHHHVYALLLAHTQELIFSVYLNTAFVLNVWFQILSAIQLFTVTHTKH